MVSPICIEFYCEVEHEDRFPFFLKPLNLSSFFIRFPFSPNSFFLFLLSYTSNRVIEWLISHTKPTKVTTSAVIFPFNNIANQSSHRVKGADNRAPTQT